MAKASSHLAKDYVKHIDALDRLRRKQEALHQDGQLSRRDVEQIYEALYLRCITSFEALIEELFVSLLCGAVGARADIRPRIQVGSKQVARDVIRGQRKWVDWLPFDRTIEMAEAFFRGGRPFSSMSGDDRAFLDQSVCIRNAIAHQSRHALNVFNRQVVAHHSLAPRDRKVCAFLRTTFTISPIPETRYEYYATRLARIATELCS